MNRRDREELVVKLERKFLLNLIPYLIVFLVAIGILLGFLNIDLDFTDRDYAFYLMFLIDFALVVPIVTIQILLLYRNKIAKMKPKTKNDLGDITEYLQAQERFRDGNYEYETIRKEEDIKKAYQGGKKFVFQEKLGGEKWGIWEGMFLLIFCLIISIIIIISIDTYPDNLIIFIFTNGLGIGISALYVVPNYFKLKRLHKSFFVLDPKGLLKSSIWGVLKAYSWKDVDVKVYMVRYTELSMGIEYPLRMQIHITLPRGGILKIDTERYDLKEFLSFDKITEKLKQKPKVNRNERKKFKSLISDLKNYYFELFAFTFQYFFEMGKYDKYGFRILRPNVSCESECYKVWNPNLIKNFDFFLNRSKHHSNFKSSIQGFF